MRGMQAEDKAKVVDFERISCGMGAVIPDPMTMTRQSNRLKQFSTDLRRAQKSEFSYTGEDWHMQQMWAEYNKPPSWLY